MRATRSYLAGLAVCAATVIAGCGGGGGVPASQRSYFPLAEGNTWSYDLAVHAEQTTAIKRPARPLGFFRVPPPAGGLKMAAAQAVDLISTVLGSAIVEGRDYWETEARLVSSSASAYLYWRSDDDGIYRYYQVGEESADVPVLKLPPTVGDTWIIPDNEEMVFTTEAINDRVTVPRGTFSCVRVRQVDSRLYPCYTIVTWFAYGVGLVQDKTFEGDILTSDTKLVSYELN